MSRFMLKRWWACVLAIGLSVSVLAVPSHASMVDQGGSTLGGGGGDGAPQIGDPDLPGGPSKSRSGYGRVTSPATSISRTVGDGRQMPSMWELGLQALLRSLRMRTFGF